MSRLFSVEDKIVVITGGLGQLGLAYAGCLAGEAARVALLDLATSSQFCREIWLKTPTCDISRRT